MNLLNMDHQVKKDFGFLQQIKESNPKISCQDILKRAFIWKAIIENIEHLFYKSKAEKI